MQFHNEICIVLQDAPDEHFLRARAVTLSPNTQNKCVWGSLPSWRPPTWNMAIPSPPLTAVSSTSKKWRQPRLPNMYLPPQLFLHHTLHHKLTGCQAPAPSHSQYRHSTPRLLPPLDRLTLSSLWVAMILHQSHIPDSTKKIIGRWRSDDFLIYLQGQWQPPPRMSQPS